ncbi:hypothetical protein [Methanococcus voltae]|uniref:Uncharacterized protein n=1 Tax=Methanococcus voltae (strain ATCC BAA-1334 / A3) TaxID=456320 RepID=D7DSF6_METV3|nr:hypothetical protein [Methanococcus voltae]MCS3901592.1 hypothetical protein [Methanococcus voltae]
MTEILITDVISKMKVYLNLEQFSNGEFAEECAKTAINVCSVENLNIITFYACYLYMRPYDESSNAYLEIYKNSVEEIKNGTIDIDKGFKELTGDCYND